MNAARWIRGHWRTGAVIITVVFAIWVGWTLSAEKSRNDAQDAIDRARTAQLEDIVAEIDADRLLAAEASCERGNEIRAGIRALARDLNADRRTIALVDERFAAVECASAPGSEPATGG